MLCGKGLLCWQIFKNPLTLLQSNKFMSEFVDNVFDFLFNCVENHDGFFAVLDIHPLAAASRSRLLAMEPKLFVFETSYYASVDDIALNLSLRT